MMHPTTSALYSLVPKLHSVLKGVFVLLCIHTVVMVVLCEGVSRKVYSPL